MALVAYSDESDMSCDEDEQLQEKTKVNQIEKNSDNKLVEVGAASIPGSKSEDKSNEKSFLSSLPEVKKNNLKSFSINENDILNDVPTAKTWISAKNIEIQKPKKNEKVKFFVPKLSDFSDDDEEESNKDATENYRKRMKTSDSKGRSSLFSVLPPPKQNETKATKKRAEAIQKFLKPQTKAVHPIQNQLKETVNPIDNKLKEVDVEDGDYFSLNSNEDTDFFSLNKKDDTDFFSLHKKEKNMPITVQSSIVTSSDQSRLHTNDNSTISPSHSSEISPFNNGSETYSISQPSSSLDNFAYNSETYSISQPSSSLDNFAYKKKKNVPDFLRNKNVDIIDIKADDYISSRDEWLTKSLTEEKPTHSFSKKKMGGPSQKAKRKHQITFLAEQAKEREQELKNSWAAARQNKYQSQAKYGF